MELWVDFPRSPGGLTPPLQQHQPLGETSSSNHSISYVSNRLFVRETSGSKVYIPTNKKKNKGFLFPQKKGQFQSKKNATIDFQGTFFFVFRSCTLLCVQFCCQRVFSIKRSRNSETFQKGCQTKTSLNIWYVRRTVWGRPWLSSWKKKHTGIGRLFLSVSLIWYLTLFKQNILL